MYMDENLVLAKKIIRITKNYCHRVPITDEEVYVIVMVAVLIITAVVIFKMDGWY